MLYLVIATLMLSAVLIFSTAASRRADTNLVTLIINIASVLIPFIIVGLAISKKAISIQMSAIAFAVACGLCLGLYGMMINKSLSLIKVGVVVPTIFGGAILISAILSFFFFKETLRGFELAGLFLILAGLGTLIYARSVA
jgi:uncharacterized membrane protein